MKSDPLAPETQQFARFRVVREIGRGAQGAILEGIDLERDARVAIKTLRAVGAHEIARIKSEFRAVRDLRHPSLVRLGELIEEDGRWFFTMELVDGVDLLSYVRRHVALPVTTSWPALSQTTHVAPPPSDAPGSRPDAPPPLPQDRPPATFDEARLLDALVQLTSALEYLHGAGKVHRDLKPSNVIVDAAGRTVLIDFGLTSELSEEDDRQLVGTVPYMAPEQIFGEAIGPAADWYAFGVILFEAITGRRPFEGDARNIMERKCLFDPPRPSDFVREVPPYLETLCVRLLARDPLERATGADVARALGVQGAGGASREAFFVGRKRELGALARAYADVARGQAITVVLEGESGVGKSALARRFVDELRTGESPPLVLAGRCHEHESVPYNAFDAVIDGLARHLRARKATKRAELLPPRMDRVRTLFPTLGAFDGETPSDPPVALDPRALREEAFATLRELVHRVAERWPTVLLLEDVQWADADSLALLEALTEAPGAPVLLVIATARTLAEGAPCRALTAFRGEVRRIAVGGLAVGEAGDLVERLIALAGTRSSVDADAIIESAHGHPMFIEELVRYLSHPRARSGAVALDDALRARVAELGDDARHVLAVVSVAGAPTEQAVIATAAGVPFATYSDVAAVLHEAKLVRIRGPRPDDPVEPFHDRIREAVRAALDEAPLASIHGELAEALESRLAGPDLLFHHFAAAGQRDRAITYAELAAEAASRSLAFDRAAELYRSALSLGARDEAHRRRLLKSLGERLMDGGRSKEAARYFLEAASTGEPDRLEHLDLLRRAAERFLMSGHVEEGLATTRVVLGASGLTLPATWLGAVARVGWYQFRLSRRELTWATRRPDEIDAATAMRMDLCWSVGAGLGLVDSLRSVLFFARGALECLDHGDDARIARALAGAAVAEAGLLRREGAVRLGEACKRAADAEASDRSRFYAALTTMSQQFFLANDWPGTVAACREAEQLWRTTGRSEGWEVDLVDQFVCWALDNGGKFRELAERVPAKIRAAQRAGNRLFEVNFRTQFVNLKLISDRPAEARREVEDAIAAWPRTDTTFGNQHYLALRGLTAVALYERDDLAAAALLPQWRRYFASLLAQVPFLRLDALWNVGAIALRRASAARAKGDAGQVTARLHEARRARDEVARIESPYARGNGLLLQIGICALEGDVAATVRALREGIHDAETRGADLHGAVMRARLGPIAGGADGDALARAGAAWMRKENVRDPERLIGAVLPGSEAR